MGGDLDFPLSFTRTRSTASICLLSPTEASYQRLSEMLLQLGLRRPSAWTRRGEGRSKHVLNIVEEPRRGRHDHGGGHARALRVFALTALRRVDGWRHPPGHDVAWVADAGAAWPGRAAVMRLLQHPAQRSPRPMASVGGSCTSPAPSSPRRPATQNSAQPDPLYCGGVGERPAMVGGPAESGRWRRLQWRRATSSSSFCTRHRVGECIGRRAGVVAEAELAQASCRSSSGSRAQPQ